MFDWVAKIALGKAVGKGSKTIAALLAGGATSEGIVSALNSLGISVSIDQNVLATGLAGVLLGLYEFLRNYLKSKGKNLP